MKIFRMLSESERLERICDKLPAGKTNKDFSIFNENQYAVFYNKFALDQFKFGIETLNSNYCKVRLREQEKNPRNSLWGYPACVEDNFYRSLDNFLQVNPKLRDERLKSKVLPYILKFENKYVANSDNYMQKLLSKLEYTTPNKSFQPKLKSNKYFQNLSKEKKKAIKKADKIALKKIYSKGKYSNSRIKQDFNRMSELYEIAGEIELSQFCGTWPLGDRVKSIGDLANKLIYNLINKGQIVPEKQDKIKVPEELYPSLTDFDVMKN